MPQRFSVSVPAPEHQNDLAGWIGQEPDATPKEEESGWFDWLPGIASGVTEFLGTKGGQELLKTGTQLYLTKEQREAAEKQAAATQQQQTMEQMLKIARTAPTTRPTIPTQQPPIIVQQPKAKWVLPVVIGVGALALLGGGFFLMKKKK